MLISLIVPMPPPQVSSAPLCPSALPSAPLLVPPLGRPADECPSSQHSAPPTSLREGGRGK